MYPIHYLLPLTKCNLKRNRLDNVAERYKRINNKCAAAMVNKSKENLQIDLLALMQCEMSQRITDIIEIGLNSER